MLRLLMTLLLAIPLGTRAHDLGVIGPTYPIAEQGFLEQINDRLQAQQRSGELARLELEARERAAASARTPAPVAGLQVAQQHRTYYFDPSFTLERNVVDDQGRLMFAAGLRKNPLDVVSMSKRLLIFDGRDPRQLARARSLLDEPGPRIKLILVGGSYLELMKTLRRPVYFDQQGRLTRQLGISAVPALVTQDGARLRIDELEVR